jgi:hypothetical protein
MHFRSFTRENDMKKAVLGVFGTVAVAIAGYAYAYPPYGYIYEYQDADGNAIGWEEFTCDSHTYYGGDTSGTRVIVEKYSCSLIGDKL